MGDDIDAIPTHVTTVVRAERVSPTFRRLTFGGGLERFASIAPDEFVYVLVPPPGRTELSVGTDFTWLGYYGIDEAERPVGAYYTVREHRPESGELDVDVFLHDEPGPASTWAATAGPGDPAALWGPRTAWEPPGDTDWWLLVADETGLPATARILRTLPSDAVARVFVEAVDEADVRALPAGPNVEVTWLGPAAHHAAGFVAERPADGDAAPWDALVDAVRATDLPEGTPYAWGGGESRALTALRKYLRKDVGLPRHRVSLVAYWRLALVGVAAEDDPEDEDVDDEFDEGDE